MFYAEMAGVFSAAGAQRVRGISQSAPFYVLCRCRRVEAFTRAHCLPLPDIDSATPLRCCFDAAMLEVFHRADVSLFASHFPDLSVGRMGNC